MDALQSVSMQTYDNYEIIVINDGSTDPNTNDILNNLKFPKTSVISIANGGLANARNCGIAVSNGKYILPLDADDTIGISYVEQAVVYLENNPNTQIVYCNAAFFGEQSGQWILPDFSIEHMLRQNLIFCSAVFRRSEFNKTAGYNTNMRFGWEDWDFWLSILKNGGDVYKIPETLFFYRKHGVSMVGDIASQVAKRQYLEQQLIRNHTNFYMQYFPEPLTLLRELDWLRSEKENFEEVKRKIYRSWSYRLGDALLKPFKKILSIKN